MKHTLNITKALADESRLRILMMIREKEVCVCQIVEVLGSAFSTISKHLSILKAAGLIESRKQGRWIYYHEPISPGPAVQGALDWVSQTLKDCGQIARDREKGTLVCSQDPEDIAKVQRHRVCMQHQL